MPAKTTTSNVSSKYADAIKAALERNKDTPFKGGIINLPAGIKRGIAKLETCYFSTGENGDFWRASGTVDYPETVTVDVKAIGVYGLNTSVVVMITPEGQAVAFDRIMDIMKGLAGNDLFTANAGVSLEDLSAVLSDTAKPGNKHLYFNFSTTETPEKRNPDGSVKYAARTWENWLGSVGLENYEPTKPEGMVKDNTKTKPTTNPSPNGTAPTPAIIFRDDADLASLGKRADNGDLQAIEQLTEFAEQVGIGEHERDSTPSWKEIAGKVANAGKAKPNDQNDSPDTPFVPELKSVYGIMVKGKKVKVRVDSVDANARTCTVKNLETKKDIKDVDIDSLVDGD